VTLAPQDLRHRGSGDYRAAVHAYASAERLRIISTVLTVLICLTGGLALLGGVLEATMADTTAGHWLGGAIAGGAIFWIVAGLLITAFTNTFAHDVQARAPWGVGQDQPAQLGT
jgi:cytochrome b subunit of formate dehydrogenase